MLLNIPKSHHKTDAEAPPTAEAIAEMTKYNESLTKAGVLLALDGLYPQASSTRLTFSAKKAHVKDGPFAEAKEAVGGYWMIQVKSKEEAVQWVSRCPAGEGDTIEVRQVFEMTDFAEVPQISPELSKIGARQL